MPKIRVELSGAKDKLSPQTQRRGQYAMANQMLQDMNQFVPMEEGILRLTGNISSDAEEIYYNTPYAKRRFYEPAYNYTTPGTGPRWDMKAKRLFISDWERAYMKGANW
ncbi:minor head protein [Bacillus phage BCASJ1c]|uniref:44 n=1 Tax=Bacillus phage BCASJ1c TaxID=294382 RepID=Q5YA66_9CAUD|nr:minor head protein [Bacillus phage BCASJ1c]AAU85091.1 44 [Bacillus phage BCASJ1c]